MVIYKTNVRRRVCIDKRDIYGLTSRDVIDLHPLLQCIIISAKTLKLLRRKRKDITRDRKIRRIKQIIKLLAEGVVGVLRVDTAIEEEVNLYGSKKKKKIPPRTVNGFDREGFSDQFRFHAGNCFKLLKTISVSFKMVRY